MKQEHLDLIYLCGCVVNGRTPAKSRVEEMDLEAIHKLAKEQTLSALTYYAVEDVIDKSAELSKTWQQEREMAIRKNISLDFERSKIFAELEKNGIRHMALKGAVLKDMYLRSGMRQMADNDVLYDKEHQKKVYEIFLENGYYCAELDQTHHDVYMKEPFYNFEMHTSMLTPIHKLYFYYEDIWERVRLSEGKQYEYNFSDEDFYIFMIVHAHKHFSSGGTGLRTLLDIYVYNKAKHSVMDYEYIAGECEKTGLRSFENMMRVLSWKVFSKPSAFDYKALQPNQLKILEMFFGVGTYGTVTQKVRNKLSENRKDESDFTRSDKLKYILDRTFPDVGFIKTWCKIYFKPALKYPILLPAAYVYRLIYNAVISPENSRSELKSLDKI